MMHFFTTCPEAFSADYEEMEALWAEMADFDPCAPCEEGDCSGFPTDEEMERMAQAMA